MDNSALLVCLHIRLVEDCWSENPKHRPSIDGIKQSLSSLSNSRDTTNGSGSLMDHMLSVMEEYANSLEEEVQERTKELAEEKKKSDLLLYRILPKHLAERLKLGLAAEPESYESVTILFSHVVDFASLTARCSPLQVVNFLNDLYSLFDNAITEFDVYKVETISDSYLCASGVPNRNGSEHGREIANMSLTLLERAKGFKIPHIPEEEISIRIGFHTGPCVAGVVGLSMPRYCLFGDTVNTASRMESNGKAGKIHISAAANHLLTNVLGGYRTECRGELLIKGKGVMETFWLLTGE